MKYLITESQIDKLIFDYLDNRLKDLYEVDNNDSVFFWDSKDSWYNGSRPILSFYTKIGHFGLSPNLITELSSFFSLDPEEIIKMIVLWFMDKTKLSVSDFYIM